MHLTQLLILEASPRCNLSDAHKWCPCDQRQADRLTEPKAHLPSAAIAIEAHKLGFRGYIGFHYYNEPCAHHEPLLAVMNSIVDSVPGQRFLLWTNGTVRVPRQFLRSFDLVVMSDHTAAGTEPTEWGRIASCGIPVARHVMAPDKRLREWPTEALNEPVRCLVPFTEFIVDAWGDVHLCCYAWRKEQAIGNVHEEPLEEIVHRWKQFRIALAMGDNVMLPACCETCPFARDEIAQIESGAWVRATAAVGEWRKGDTI